MSFFERNLQFLAAQNPMVGAQLLAFEGNERIEVFQDPSDALNVNLFDHLYGAVFYDGIPQQEIVEKVDRFEGEYNRYPVLFVYGAANGLFLKLLLQNPNHTHIIVIEPEIELLYIALNLIDFSAEMEQRRIFFFTNDQIDFARAVEIVGHPAIKVFCKTYHLEPSTPYYESHYAEAMLRCNANMIRAIEHVVTGLGNDTTDALIGLEWHLANVSKMVETPTLLELVAKAKTTETAIIVSTGPSLAKQLPLLQSIQEHATLLSVDASLPILERHGIKPDIVFSIERVAETAEFYRRTSSEFQKGIICAMSSLSHPLLVESACHMTMQMSMRPFGYTRYFDLPEYGYIGIGMSAANMAYELAYHAGFKTIILVGQDLSYGADGASHSEGHVFGSIKHQESDFEIEGYGGIGTVRTSRVWNMFRNFFENDIQIASQNGVITLNATEGGARIHGALELPFAEAIETYVDRSTVKRTIVLGTPAETDIRKNKEKVKAKIAAMETYAEAMQKKVSDLFEKVAASVETMDRIAARTHLEEVNYDELASLMGEIDEIKAKFDDIEFVDVFIDATQALIVHHELEIARIQVRPVQNDDDRRLKMIDWIYAHQHWLFALAGIMEAELVAIRRRGSESRYVHKAEFAEETDILSGNFYDYTGGENTFELELAVDGEGVVLQPLDASAKNTKGNFTLPIPARFFDDQVHMILIREKQTGIVLTGMPERRILPRAERTKAEFFESFSQRNSAEYSKEPSAGGIGFLAIHENIGHEGFVAYIKTLQSKFPSTHFTAFYFTPDEKEAAFQLFGEQMEYLLLSDVDSVTENIAVYLHNTTQQAVHDVISAYCRTIYIVYYNEAFKNATVYTQGDRKFGKGRQIIERYREFGFTEEEIASCDANFVKLTYCPIAAHLQLEKKQLQDDENLFDVYCIEYVDLAVKYPEFREYFFEFRKTARNLAG